MAGAGLYLRTKGSGRDRHRSPAGAALQPASEPAAKTQQIIIRSSADIAK